MSDQSWTPTHSASLLPATAQLPKSRPPVSQPQNLQVIPRFPAATSTSLSQSSRTTLLSKPSTIESLEKANRSDAHSTKPTILLWRRRPSLLASRLSRLILCGLRTGDVRSLCGRWRNSGKRNCYRQRGGRTVSRWSIWSYLCCMCRGQIGGYSSLLKTGRPERPCVLDLYLSWICSSM